MPFLPTVLRRLGAALVAVCVAAPVLSFSGAEPAFLAPVEALSVHPGLVAPLATGHRHARSSHVEEVGGAIDDPSRGLVWAGLQPADGAGPCASGYQATVHGFPSCTHGPDVAPPGVDVTAQRSTEELAAGSGGGEQLGATGRIGCFGDGTSGGRVQAVYARAADVPDRYPSIAASLRQWAANADAAFADSAAKTGGTRHVRFVTDQACDLVVQRVQLSAAGDDTMTATMGELRSLGLDRTDRKYLIWVDNRVYCGIAQRFADDRPTADNLNNSGPMYARVDTGCWGLSASLEAHELMHTFGGVQNSAPNATGRAHCTDDADLMCHRDSSGASVRQVCPIVHERLFDCNDNDYFHTSPPAGSYLATHWNTANSRFLEASAAPPPTTTTTAPPTTTTTAPPTTTTTTPPTTTTTAPPTTTTTAPPTTTPPATTTREEAFTSSVDAGSSRHFPISSGAGELVAHLSFSSSSYLTLTVRDATGTIVGQRRGSGPLALSLSVPAGDYTATVSKSAAILSLFSSRTPFTLRLLYEAP